MYFVLRIFYLYIIIVINNIRYINLTTVVYTI
nr:MAG TPA: hypothetical protein [Caudoviricetes sp.]